MHQFPSSIKAYQNQYQNYTASKSFENTLMFMTFTKKLKHAKYNKSIQNTQNKPTPIKLHRNLTIRYNYTKYMITSNVLSTLKSLK